MTEDKRRREDDKAGSAAKEKTGDGDRAEPLNVTKSYGGSVEDLL